MRSNRALILTLLCMIVLAAFYRVIPDRPMGFAPHLAMALFAGAVIRNKTWALTFPILSMFLSDLVYQLLYLRGLTSIQGLYPGQLGNYLLFAGMVCIGFYMKRISVKNIAVFSFLVAVVFFLSSNFLVWVNGWGFARPHTLAGLLLCYVDALPFFVNSLVSTLVFSGVLFGAWRLLAGKLNVRLVVA